MHDSSVVHCIFLLSRLLSLSFCKSLIHCKQWLTEVNWSNFAFSQKAIYFLKWLSSWFLLSVPVNHYSVIPNKYILPDTLQNFLSKIIRWGRRKYEIKCIYVWHVFSYSLLWSHFHWGVLAVGILLQVWSGGGLILKLVAMSNHWVYQHCIFKTDKISEIITQWSVLHKLLMIQH